MITEDLTSVLYKNLLADSNPDKIGFELKVIEKKIA